MFSLARQYHLFVLDEYHHHPLARLARIRTIRDPEAT